MSIKHVVKIWLCERQGGWLCYQCLEMPEELRGKGQLFSKVAWVQILSGEKPYIYCASVFLNGENRYLDGQPWVVNCKHDKNFKQEILASFDEWSGGLRVHCDNPDEYAWLIGEADPVDWEKAQMGHPVWLNVYTTGIVLYNFNRLEHDRIFLSQTYDIPFIKDKCYLAEPLPQDEE